MSGYDYIVPPRSWDAIAMKATEVRCFAGREADPYFPIMDFLELVMDQRLGLIRLEVGSREDMRGSEGHTCPKGEFIELREDVYAAAWRGDGRARFTAAHELGHLFLHTNVPLARAEDSRAERPFRLSEPQANQFAAELLMPRSFFSRHDDESAVMERHGVSREAAGNRLAFLVKKGRI